MQLGNSELFKNNTERTLNSIKQEFEYIVTELDEIRKKDTQRHKSMDDCADTEKESYSNPRKSSEVDKKTPGEMLMYNTPNTSNVKQKPIPKQSYSSNKPKFDINHLNFK